MLRNGLLVACLLLSGWAQAQELRLHITKNRISFVEAFLENVGQEPVTVVTGNLVYESKGDRVEVYPKAEYWERKDGKILLKSSVNAHAPVTLRPGEVTALQNPNVRVVTKVVEYRIDEDWAALHGTWAGKVEAQVHN